MTRLLGENWLLENRLILHISDFKWLIQTLTVRFNRADKSTFDVRLQRGLSHRETFCYYDRKRILIYNRSPTKLYFRVALFKKVYRYPISRSVTILGIFHDIGALILRQGWIKGESWGGGCNPLPPFGKFPNLSNSSCLSVFHYKNNSTLFSTCRPPPLKRSWIRPRYYKVIVQGSYPVRAEKSERYLDGFRLSIPACSKI